MQSSGTAPSRDSAPAPDSPAQQPVTLASGSLGLAESTIMGVAGNAPAFSVAASTATLIATVGVLSPASLLYCGLIMFGAALAFRKLNKIDPNAGASYAWVSAIFGPTLGFFAGWSVLIAQAVFMISGTVPVATATLALTVPHLVADTSAVAFVAAAWLVVIIAIAIKGIKLASYVQVFLTTIEVAVLAVIVGAALVKFGSHPAHPFSWSWFALSQFTPGMFAKGALTAVFVFWGWDIALNLNEETKDAGRIPGYAAIAAVIIAVLLFVGFAVAALLTLTDAEIDTAGTGIVQAVADKLFPQPWSYIAVIAVMLSTIGTLEASILGFTRTLYAKSRGGSLHERYSRLHPQWQTPWIASLALLVIGVSLVIGSSYLPTVATIMRDSVNTIGFQASFYYALACFACAWSHWHVRREGAIPFLLTVVWPSFSAVFLIFVATYSIPTFDLATNLVGLGGIAVGVIPLLMHRKRRQAVLSGTA